MEWTSEKSRYRISDNQAELQPDAIIAWLRGSYWASERSEEAMKASWGESLCFGVYGEDGRQAGFMRVVTDGATFSWLCDVIVDPDHRGAGLGKWMMEVLVSHPRIRTTNLCLRTRDAHGLYEKYGFVRQEVMFRRAAAR